MPLYTHNVLRFCLFVLLIIPHAQAQTNPERGAVRVVILGDFNGSYGSLLYPPELNRALEATLRVWQPDLLLSAGDVVAGQSTSLPDERFTEMWAAFDAAVARPLRESGIPYAFAVGNHDGSSLRAGDGTFLFERERAAARAYWQQPRHNALTYQDRDDFPFNYSFTFGEIFFTVWDASSAVITDDQLAWLTAELTSPTAKSARLRVLVGHLPLYGVGEGKNKPGEVLSGAKSLRQQLEYLGIDLYISGHHAAYYPARAGSLTLLHSGGIGARRLVGSGAEPRSTVTILDIDSELRDLRFTTFDVSSFEVVALESLPERLDGLNGPLWRVDRAPEAP